MKVAQLNRYPVKSMLGESLDEAIVGPNGIAGDRAWALRAEGATVTGKKYPQLMSAQASFVELPTNERGSAAASITLPDGTCFETNDDQTPARLSAWLETEVSLWPLVSPDNLEFFRRAPAGDISAEQMDAQLRAVFSRLPDEPLPDLASFPAEVLEFDTPPGTYFDAYPILLMSETALNSLSSRASNNFDQRRFRPNILIKDMTADSAGGNNRDFPENNLAGKHLKIGDVVLSVEMPCPRCIMTTHPVAELPKDPNIMRQLVTHNDGNLGVYARIIKGGTMRLGDTMEILDNPQPQRAGS